MSPLVGRPWIRGCGLTLLLSLAATVPTTGDFGLTWDEPAYRYSQILSQDWWERLLAARSRAELAALLDPDALLYYWPYGRHGINFHPPLAGQLNLLTYVTFRDIIKDIPARRLASVLEYAATITLVFGFLSRRYGAWVGGVAAASLLLMPRVYGDGHIAGTDTPGLLLWTATACAFWKGLHEPNARRWRIAVGLLVGLSFIEKMAAVTVVLPLLAWLVVGRLPKTFVRDGGKADWIDGLVTTVAMLLPLAIAYVEIRRLAALLPEPNVTDLFVHRPPSSIPGAILAAPLTAWFLRRGLAMAFPNGRVWGIERPALETFAAILGFAPAVAWLGNPAWWRETLPRLAHYYLLNTNREGSLPDIRIMYLGQTYLYSLPWPNAWVLIGVTVPVGILLMGAVGCGFAIARLSKDRLPFYFVVHFATLPVLRMLPTPAHDGVRLLLPAFAFLAGLAGWGLVWLADGLSRAIGIRPVILKSVLAALVLGEAAIALVRIHPFELSYYNRLIGGPRGAWAQGFELSYWYDAFDGEALRALNARLPRGAVLAPPNEFENVPTFQELQTLGALRDDLVLNREPDGFPFMWLLTHDSKADPFSRLLFAMRPWFARRPRQLDGLRVATVADPTAVSRAWALSLLANAPGRLRPSPPLTAPSGIAAIVGRLKGEGLTRAPKPGVNETILEWAKTDPDGLRRAALGVIAAFSAGPPRDTDASRLWAILTRGGAPAFDRAARLLLTARPEALTEAVAMLIARPEAVREVLLREPYTDPDAIGGFLDRDLPEGRVPEFTPGPS